MKKKIKVILESSIRNIGPAGSLAMVKKGFFRYLLSKKMVSPYSSNFEKYEEKKLEIESKELKKKDKFLEYKDKLENKFVCFARQASSSLSLYGSVSTKDIRDYIEENYQISLEDNNIVIPHPIKKIGLFKINIYLSHKINFNIKVVVERSMEEARKIASS